MQLRGLLLVLLLCSSCRFKTANVSEGQEFASRGVFPVGAPAWVKPDPASGTPLASDVGIMPRSYTSPTTVKVARSNGPTGEAPLTREETPVERARMQSKAAATQKIGANAVGRKGAIDSSTGAAAVAPTEPVDQNAADEESPLDRIAKNCPGMEKSVNAALTTTTAAERIGKYESLTARCTDSVDLWIWLGKDYASVKRYNDAERSFRRALSLDGKNSEAESQLQQLESRRGAATKGKAADF